ncbi:uncharacterized protein K489DRAFT_64748 [Dissoconium aciculare CBS 342.82]|uniref:Uncharacterized protein n=1 Tax=Dissoconium aciculare CBS 342.82 TaxID=1314786 RepID=A0A6J3LU97_9PEZI|nr:uncharacterized protein K489DRAFT_64748 [Dissoconium aciculare CBS 342.82]KAF1819361.1 hypothetical protein K489DRAFT_64748 [Dissoconium aciculare CBS 342.82]
MNKFPLCNGNLESLKQRLLWPTRCAIACTALSRTASLYRFGRLKKTNQPPKDTSQRLFVETSPSHKLSRRQTSLQRISDSTSLIRLHVNLAKYTLFEQVPPRHNSPTGREADRSPPGTTTLLQSCSLRTCAAKILPIGDIFDPIQIYEVRGSIPSSVHHYSDHCYIVWHHPPRFPKPIQ